NLIAHIEKEWRLTVGRPYPSSYNYVAPVQLKDCTQAVLKIGFPSDPEFQTEIEALKVFDGHGAARLIKADRKKSVILIERDEPGVMLAEANDDSYATRVLASVMKRLWKPVPRDRIFPNVADWAKGVRCYRERFGHSAGPIPLDLIDKADELFEELIDTMRETVLVHGDLHHYNVLSSHRDSWLAIDPKGIVSEPAHEAAAMLRNPVSELYKYSDLRGTLRSRL